MPGSTRVEKTNNENYSIQYDFCSLIQEMENVQVGVMDTGVKKNIV